MNRFTLDASIFTGQPHPDITVHSKAENELHLSVRSDAGTGSFSQYVFSDFVFSIAKNHNREDFIIEERIASPAIWFHFNPVGSIFHRLDQGRHAVSRASASNVLSFNRPVEYEIRKDSPNISLVIALTPDRFLSMNERNPALPCRLIERRIRNARSDNILLDGSNVTPGMEMIISEITGSPYRCAANCLYIEEKVCDLLGLRIDQLIESYPVGSMRRDTFILRTEDIERIRRAKEILMNRLDDPPTIAGLAQSTGINEYKLKNGFKLLFGKTIFGYLREKRLEIAKTLIRKREMNIAEIAFAVGFNNPAHFADCFRRHYGINPGRLLMEKRKTYLI